MAILINVIIGEQEKMEWITKVIGSKSAKTNYNSRNSIHAKRILIVRPPNSGNNQCFTPSLITEVSEIFPNCRIDLFVKGSLSSSFFKNYSGMNGILQVPKKPSKSLLNYIKITSEIPNRKYDIIINADNYSLSNRSTSKSVKINYKFYNETNNMNTTNSTHFAKQQVNSLSNYLIQSDKLQIKKSKNELDLKLSPIEIKEGKVLLNNIVKSINTKTICLFTYSANANCIPDGWWIEFYILIKKQFPDINIIEVLPIENKAKIAFNEPKFYSKSMRQTAALIKNTALFIGTVSDMAKLAISVQTPSLALFSANDKYIYEPYNELSLAANINYCSTAELIKIITQRIDSTP